jgi:menaquinone-specific isochorismate synthase
MRFNGQAGLEKIVLARQVIFRFTESIPRLLLFELLRQATPNCFHFYCQFDDANSFLGASPERLYRRRGRQVESEAVAGTGRRGLPGNADAELGHALLLSDKNQREHAFVRESIRKGFETLCTTMQIEDKASLLDLSMGRHLRSKFQGHLNKGVTDVEILTHLPPTAAVGGHPREKSLRRIRELEPFDRGWYAGPIGWFAREAAEFAVAIRSGLVSDHSLALYSGAGIVEGSEPASEWEEIEQKIGDFIRVLGLDQRRTTY